MEQRTSVDISQINEMIERESVFIDALTNEMNKVIVGQKHMVNALLIGLLGKGHILLEGVPGLAKTPSTPLLNRYTGRLAVSSLHRTYCLPMW